LIYSKIAISAFCLVSHGCRQISSPLILARQGYAQHDPERGFEERLDGGVLRFQMISLIISSASQAIFELVTIAFAAHGHREAILAQDFLVVVSPMVSAIRTASWRNSSVRFSPTVGLLWCHKCYQRSGIKP
jgi:hypothetical protein